MQEPSNRIITPEAQARGAAGDDRESVATPGRGLRYESAADTGATRTDYWTDRGPGPRVMAASTLQGNDVYNDQDDKLGSVTDVMLDVPTGRVAYAVMSVGGMLGVGDRLLAIPWSALRLDTAKECFRLDASKERVENAPGFDKDHWPVMADQQWAENLHNYYDARPYWS